MEGTAPAEPRTAGHPDDTTRYAKRAPRDGRTNLAITKPNGKPNISTPSTTSNPDLHDPTATSMDVPHTPSLVKINRSS